MASIRPITSRVAARLLNRNPFQDAVEVIEVESATEWPLKPIIALPNEIDRLVSHNTNSKPERNIELLALRTLRQGPCRIHRVEDAIIADGTVLTKSSYQAIQQRDRRWILRDEPEVLEEVALCSTWLTELYFGHWLHDGLAHELLATVQGVRPVTLTGVNRPHEHEYRKLVGLPANPISFARVKNLWLLEDWELGHNRQRRLEELGRRVRAHFPGKGPERVFLARGVLGVGRHLTNEPEVTQALEGRGFTILRPEQMTPSEIVQGLKDARIVAGVEGSALSHALIAAPPDAGFLSIIAPRHFNMFLRTYTGARGSRYAYTIADVVDENSFSQPIDRLLRTLDLLEAALP